MFGVRAALVLATLTLGSHLAFAQTRVKANTYSIALPNAWKSTVYTDAISVSLGSGAAWGRVGLERHPTQNDPKSFFERRWNRRFDDWKAESDSNLQQTEESNIRILTRAARLTLNSTQFASFIYLYTADWTFTIEVTSPDYDLFQKTVEEATDAIDSLEGLPEPNRPAPGSDAPRESTPVTTEPETPTEPSRTTTAQDATNPRNFREDAQLVAQLDNALTAFYNGENPAEALGNALRIAGFAIVNPDGTVKSAPIGPENGMIVTELEIKDFAELDQSGTLIPLTTFTTPINRLLYGGTGTTLNNPVTTAIGNWIAQGRRSLAQSDRLTHALVTNLASQSERPLEPFLPTNELRIRPAIYLILSSVARKIADTAPKAPDGLLAALQPAPRPQPAVGGILPLAPVEIPLSNAQIRGTKSLAKMIQASTKFNLLAYFSDDGRLVRTTNRTPGARKEYTVATFLMYKDTLGLISEMAGAINDAPVKIDRGDGMQINPTVPSAIDAAGVEVELIVPDNPVFSAQTTKLIADQGGLAKFPLLGKPQEKDLNPNKVFRVNKDQEATARVTATWEQLKKALIFRFDDPRINAVLDSAMAGVTWDLAKNVTIPVTDVSDAAARLEGVFKLNGSFTRSSGGTTFTRVARRTFRFIDCETSYFVPEIPTLDEETLRSLPASMRADYQRGIEEVRNQPLKFITSSGTYAWEIFDHTYRSGEIGDCISEFEEFNLTKVGNGKQQITGDPLGNISVEVDKQNKKVTVTIRAAYRFTATGTRKTISQGNVRVTDLGNANGNENNDLWGLQNPEDEGISKFVMPYTVIDTPKERILTAQSTRKTLEQPLKGSASLKILLVYPKPPSE